jgi:Tol biopolymer transport system component
MHDANAVWSPDAATVAYLSERSGFVELHLTGAEDRQLTSARADHSDPQWHPDGTRLLAVRNRRSRFELVAVDARTGEAETLARGGTRSRPHWTPGGGVIGEYSDHATAPELRSAGGPMHAPAPLSVRRAPHAAHEDVAFASFDGLEDRSSTQAHVVG